MNEELFAGTVPIAMATAGLRISVITVGTLRGRRNRFPETGMLHPIAPARFGHTGVPTCTAALL